MGPSKSVFVAVSALYGVLLLAPAVADAQVARVEMHTFDSTTLTDQEFLTGKKEGKHVVLAGELRIPKSGTDRLAAVVLVHGSGGVSGYVDDWVTKLNAMGVATFVFDSFTPRGIVSTVEDQSQLGRLSMAVDVYRALALVARHPRINPDRIGVMGFSRGGQAALYSSLKRFQKLHGPADASFALYMLFYPQCGTTYLQDEDVVDRPIRIFHGVADDYVPVAPCRRYVERLRKAGKNVTLTAYPGAYHVFDGVAFKVPVRLARAQTVRNCRIEEVSPGNLVNMETKKPFTYEDACVERGVTVAYNAEAHADAQRAVADLVNTVLKQK
jgi:dienelactone hydrolase